MNEEISKLIDLQGIDSEIDGFDLEIKAKEQEIIERNVIGRIHPDRDGDVGL